MAEPNVRSIVLSTLGVVAVGMCLVAMGDYHGYDGPVALENVAEHDSMANVKSRQLQNNYKSAVAASAHTKVTNPIDRQAAAEKSQTNKLSWVQQTNKAKSILSKSAVKKPVQGKTPSKHMMAVLRRSKVEELVAKRQKAIAAKMSKVDKRLVAHSKATEEQKMAAKMLMQGTMAHKLKAFRPVHLFGGEFAKQEGAREHKRSAKQELSHLSKLNDEIFGAAPKTAWKVQTADQELASFGSLNRRVIGTKKYSRLGADSAAKELAQDSAINAKVFAKHTKGRGFKGDSAAEELKSLKAIDNRVVPTEDMSSGYTAKGTLSPMQIKKAWKARRHPTLAAKAADKAGKTFEHQHKMV